MTPTPIQPTPVFLKEIFDYRRSKRDMLRDVYVIEATMEAFGLPVKIMEINPNPNEILFLAKPLKSMDATEIVSHDKDLAIALASPTGAIKIEAPVPGKDLIGISLPRVGRIGFEVYNFRLANKPAKVNFINKMIARWCLNMSERLFRKSESWYGPVNLNYQSGI